MSAESREKAKRHGQKSGKGTQIVSRLMAKLKKSDEKDTDE